MAKLLARIKNLLAWSELAPYEFFNPTPETIQRWKEATDTVAVKGDGKAVFMPLMSEEEMTQHLKENDLGWKKVYDKVRNLGNPDA